jgi:cell pole-organizing protein PopZ
MSQTAKVQEPSMEEILASIRRIIADDDGRPKAPEPARLPELLPAPRAVAPPPPPLAPHHTISRHAGDLTPLGAAIAPPRLPLARAPTDARSD